MQKTSHFSVYFTSSLSFHLSHYTDLLQLVSPFYRNPEPFHLAGEKGELGGEPGRFCEKRGFNGSGFGEVGLELGEGYRFEFGDFGGGGADLLGVSVVLSALCSDWYM